MRLDLYLHTLYPQYSKRQWARFIDLGYIKKNTSPLSKGTDTRGFSSDWVPTIDWEGINSQVDWRRPLGRHTASVVYEDDFLIVAHKPSGIACHPNHPQDPETLLDQIRKEYVQPETREGYLLNRLDIGTSGLVVFAKTQESYVVLVPVFRSKTTNGPRFTKTYYARVWGVPQWSELICSYSLAHSKKSNQKVVAIVPQNLGKQEEFRGSPRPAETRFRRLSQDRETSRLEAEITSGMMHQIRVHCASLGHPIIGDQIYGKQDTESLHVKLNTPGASQSFTYHLLDCWKVQCSAWEKYPEGLTLIGPKAEWALDLLAESD